MQTERPMICDCGSNRISTKKNIGSDIDPSGEENQHMDLCLDCGMMRYWVERWDFRVIAAAESGPKIYWGKWKKSRFPFDI